MTVNGLENLFISVKTAHDMMLFTGNCTAM